jgi:uncharacterized protein (TIGR03084 family)
MPEIGPALPQFDVWAAEVADLDQVLGAISDADWDQVTPFKGWRVRDHVNHLYVSDRLAGFAAADPERFRARPRGVGRQAMEPATEIAPQALLERWRSGVSALGSALAPLDASARLPWFGPDMSARAFITARQMETWAHGQTIHDALGLRRAPTDRLHGICDLGWRTRGWSFRVRGREPPAVSIELRLTAPSGGLWTWGEEGALERVEGAAEDFALVVCQCRNVADTGLRAQGLGAAEWMAIAQCFAGAASDPPPPGARAIRIAEPRA